MSRKPTEKGHVLAARNARVLYVPSTKVASSTMRLLLAEANGTYRPDLIPHLDGPTISVEQSVHNMAINGLVHMELLPPAEQAEMKSSDAWWRVAAVRNPYARLYSAWENRILLRAPSQVLPEAWDACADVMVDDRIDLGESFRSFVRVLAERPEMFGRDSHFKSQAMHFDLTPLDLTHVVRLDEEGDLARFAADLGQRVGKSLVPKRLNEGLGLTYRDVTDAATAAVIREIFADDFARFEFVDESFPAAMEKCVATTRETQAIRYARSLTTRLEQLSRLARYRTTSRHVVAQGLRNLGLRR
ncbi:MAG: hypothetical protein RIQ64_1154 [Actinomycetota bacterium]|jgi:hypothetical protein